MRKFVLALLAAVVLPLGGCELPFWKVDKFQSYHPEIKDISVYPGMRTREMFYSDMAAFWEKCKTEKPTVEDLLDKAYEINTVLEAREEQIEKYNTWAKEQNHASGYEPKDF